VRTVTAIARRALLVGSAGLWLALLASAIVTLRATAADQYWQAGYYPLLFSLLWEQWDAWVPVVAGAAVLVAAAMHLRRGAPTRGLMAPLVLVALLVGLRALAALDGWRRASGPNLLLISIDTLRADHLSAYGYPRSTSPVLDRRLAAEGVTFERAYSQSPKTTPSHMTMLTSLYPSVHGVTLWDGTSSSTAHALNPAVFTLAEVLRNAGYATAAFTGGAYMDGAWGFRQGFQVYEECYGRELGRARRWLRRHRRGKFFLLFHTYQVHDPYVPPLPLVDQFDREYDGPVREVVKRLRRTPAAWEDAHRIFWDGVDPGNPRDVRFVGALYDAGIRNMDETTLTLLLDQLDAFGLTRDTLVVFTSDHGEAFGEHGRFLHDDLYAGTLHVPLILRFPGRLPAGRRVAERVRLVDLVPTLLELLRVPPPPDVQGRSVMPAVTGSGERSGRSAVSDYGDTARQRVFESLRRDDLTYIVDGPSEELFDATADPGERKNLAAARPAALESARAELARWRADNTRLTARLAPTDSTIVPSDEAVRRLRSLGYVE